MAAVAAAKAHEAALRDARLALKAVEGEAGLARATDVAVLYVGRSLTEWLPLLTEYSARQSVASREL